MPRDRCKARSSRARLRPGSERPYDRSVDEIAPRFEHLFKVFRALACAAVLLGACDQPAAGAGDGGVGACGDAGCAAGLTCCGGACVNFANDIHHCGGCTVTCGGPSPFYSGGSCAQAPCNPGVVCSAPNATLCCGASCCAAGQLCCDINHGGPSRGPECAAPVAGTCPVGCPLCK
jgi:hypothetical protein